MTDSPFLFDGRKREALKICGSVSGRDVADKWETAGLTPCCVEVEGGKAVAVSEAEMIFVCRKLYVQEMLPECFVDEKSKETWYPQKDYHVMYMAEIEKVLVRE